MCENIKAQKMKTDRNSPNDWLSEWASEWTIIINVHLIRCQEPFKIVTQWHPIAQILRCATINRF